MDILLDTHILLWALTYDDKLTKQMIDIISDKNNKIFYSIATVWEVEIKNSIGKMPVSGRELSDYCRQAGFDLLEIKESHIFELQTLKRDANIVKHNDPFDRIMLSQAKTENMSFLTHDSLIVQYDEPCVFYV